VVLSKREKSIAIITFAALAILGLDQLIVDPLLARKANVESLISAKQDEMDAANRLFTVSRRANQKWAQMQTGGLRREAADAENLLYTSVRDWAADSGLTVSSQKAERTEKEKDLTRVTLRATGTGSMQQIGRFLWHIQNASVPVRINELVLNSRKEGTDDLAIQIAISTIYLPAEDKNAKTTAALPREELQ